MCEGPHLDLRVGQSIDRGKPGPESEIDKYGDLGFAQRSESSGSAAAFFLAITMIAGIILIGF